MEKKGLKMRKNGLMTILSVMLAFLMAAIPSLQIAAAESQNNGEYLAEIKIGVGKTAEEAEKSLEGYTILKDGNSYVDLNQKAGGGIGSKGERVVYLGYKTTTDRAEAITDLAVMNMKGGYSVKDYELLMEQYMTEQIIPFVENFITSIKEYRENYNSSNEENKARAQYVHDALNKLTDDDCGDAGLGDLLLNETKYEMGDAAYEALSEEDKKKHADIVTIITQANGKATLLIENLITRASDTNEDTWIDRFTSTSYDDLLALYPDMLPSEAEAMLAKEYDDDAHEILSMWSVLKEQLSNYDQKTSDYELLEAIDLSAQYKITENFNLDNATEEQIKAYAEAIAEITVTNDNRASLYADISVNDYLSNIEHGDGTLADFFSQDYQIIKNDITILYPLVASLTEGQRAGLAFITLEDLVMFTVTDSEGYNSAKINELESSSIYEGVDRDIYKKGGVALTSEALRSHAAEEVSSRSEKLSSLTYAMYGLTTSSLIAFGVGVFNKIGAITDIEKYTTRIQLLEINVESAKAKITGIQKYLAEFPDTGLKNQYLEQIDECRIGIANTQKELVNEQFSGTMERLEARSAFSSKLLIGLGVVAVVLSAVSIYMTYRNLVDYYKVDYTPIPKYMVDEKDITIFNDNGEKIVIKNQAAYYKAVETNRAEGDEWFDILGSSADLNGTVGRQWLALYAAKNENEVPIVASSLKAVIGKDDVPADYTAGIHMFGSDAACNLNHTDYVWNNEATSVFIYFNVDGTASAEPSTAGTSFTAGYLVLTGVIGLVIGAGLGAVVMILAKRKNRSVK